MNLYVGQSADEMLASEALKAIRVQFQHSPFTFDLRLGDHLPEWEIDAIPNNPFQPQGEIDAWYAEIRAFWKGFQKAYNVFGPTR